MDNKKLFSESINLNSELDKLHSELEKLNEEKKIIFDQNTKLDMEKVEIQANLKFFTNYEQLLTNELNQIADQIICYSKENNLDFEELSNIKENYTKPDQSLTYEKLEKKSSELLLINSLKKQRETEETEKEKNKKNDKNCSTSTQILISNLNKKDMKYKNLIDENLAYYNNPLY